MVRHGQPNEALIPACLAELAGPFSKVGWQPLAEALPGGQISEQPVSICEHRWAANRTDWNSCISFALGFAPLAPVVWIG